MSHDRFVINAGAYIAPLKQVGQTADLGGSTHSLRWNGSRYQLECGGNGSFKNTEIDCRPRPVTCVLCLARAP